MRNFLTTVTNVASLITVLSAVVGVIWYFASLDGRVRQIETQLHTLAVAPILSAATKRDAESPETTQGEAESSMTAQGEIAGSPIPNPVAQACADLARQAATVVAQGGFRNSSEIRSIMQDMGCLVPQ